MPEQNIPSHINMNLEKGLYFFRLLHAILDGSIARGGGGGDQNAEQKKKHHVFNTSETVF